MGQVTLTAPPASPTRDAGAVRAAAGAITVTTVSVLPVFLTGALAVQLGNELGFDPIGLGLVVALYFGVSALCSLPVGRLVERWGGAVTSRIAVLGVAVVMLVLAVFADSYVSLVVILLCGAWCNVMGQLASNLTLARSVPAHRLGLSFGVKQAAIPLATLLAGAAVPAVALTVGWRWAYVIASGLALLALLGAPRGGEYVRVPKPPPGERATLALSVLGAGSGLGAGAANALGIFLVAAAVDRGIDPGTAGLVLTFGSVVGFAGRLLHGWLADRREGGHVAFVAGSMALGAVGLVAARRARHAGAGDRHDPRVRPGLVVAGTDAVRGRAAQPVGAGGGQRDRADGRVRGRVRGADRVRVRRGALVVRHRVARGGRDDGGGGAAGGAGSAAADGAPCGAGGARAGVGDPPLARQHLQALDQHP